jgi:hypothetical protein
MCKTEKSHELFKMVKQMLRVFLDGTTSSAVSGLAHFFKETAPETLPTACSVFLDDTTTPSYFGSSGR